MWIKSIIFATEKRYLSKEKKIILKPLSMAREDWELAFQKMSENKDDIPLDKDHIGNSTSWDKEEWEW